MSIYIDSPATVDVYGDGAFHTWGDHLGPFLNVTKVKLTWSTGGTEKAVLTSGLPTCTWHVSFTGIPKDILITMEVYGMKGMPPTEQVGATTTFTCRGHRRMFVAKAPDEGQPEARREK